MTNPALERLRYHVTGAIERGEKEAVENQPITKEAETSYGQPGDPICVWKGAGEAMFGHSWQSDLGRALGVDRRTISRWATHQQTPRPGVLVELRALMRDRQEELGRRISAITSYLEQPR